jgi:hypothetical protein
MSDNLSDLERSCSRCSGHGYLYSGAWAAWWRKHDRDWQQALAANQDLPDEPEEQPCRECEGKGTIPNEEGWALLRFLGRHLEDFQSKNNLG